jgi:5-methylcytosine-specific restriction protein A
MKPRKPCKAPLCPGLTAGKYCEAHAHLEKQQTRAYDVQRDKDPGRQLLHSRTWRAARAMKLANAPLCERHLAQGRTVAAVLVHHRDGNELNNLDSNHESLCTECHEQHHGKERSGR